MTKLQVALACFALAVASVADAQAPTRIRGTITALDGNAVSVKTRDGKEVKFTLTDDATVAVAKAIKFEDIKQGDYVGATGMKRPDGTVEAVEVHYLAPTVPSGHGPWDLQPGSTMTNANVEATVQSAKGRELTLKYKDGTQTLVVPEGTPLVRVSRWANTFSPSPNRRPTGNITAQRIQVSKDGIKPPQ